ncbi:hypothetical protein [uncultured Sulfitobacter sp.]|uniref:hypothetical protein n=1 Tax=uncultured Sulfitobacter sp. TaxID=191468 RepID=UPI0030DBA751|tara:strand:+ start:3191 stop:3445 length:255 start_codon:yes stop_codon:yes gene_type:complete
MGNTLIDKLRRTTPARDAAFGVVGQMPVNPDGPEAAAHIDAQAAKINALVDLIGDYWTGNHFTGVSIYDAERINATLAAAKETT